MKKKNIKQFFEIKCEVNLTEKNKLKNICDYFGWSII